MPLSGWAHGHNGGGDGDIAYITDGTFEHFITVGDDALVQLRNPSTLETDDNEPIREHSEAVRAVAASRDGTYFATGGADSHVKLFSYPTLECNGTVSRFTLPVRLLRPFPDFRFSFCFRALARATRKVPRLCRIRKHA